jgi:hypothetical protein
MLKTSEMHADMHGYGKPDEQGGGERHVGGVLRQLGHEAPALKLAKDYQIDRV